MKFKTPLNMIIVGVTGCGKTYYLLKMLENNYKDHFEYIFLICPTYLWNKTYQEWKYKDDKNFFPIPCDQDEVEKFLKFVTHHFKDTNSLIILDDCASSQYVKNRSSEYRTNTQILVTFYNPDKNDMKTLLEESVDGTEEEYREIKDKLKKRVFHARSVQSPSLGA